MSKHFCDTINISFDPLDSLILCLRLPLPTNQFSDLLEQRLQYLNYSFNAKYSLCLGRYPLVIMIYLRHVHNLEFLAIVFNLLIPMQYVMVILPGCPFCTLKPQERTMLEGLGFLEPGF